MTASDKTKEQLISELREIRQRVAQLEKSDIKHKQAEKILPLPAEDYQRLFELLPIGVTILDMKGAILYCNPVVYAKGGYTEGNFTGKHFSKIASVRLKDIPTYIRVFSSVVRGKIPKPFEAIYQHKDGTTGWTELTIGLIKAGRKRRILVMQHDITERKQAEETLRKSEQFVSLLFDSITDFFTVQDTDYNIIKANKVIEATFGKGLLGRKCYQAYQDRDSICPNCPMVKVLATGKPAFSVEQEGPPGIFVEIWAFPMKDEQGNIVAVIEHGRDITERKRAGEALRKSEEALQRMFEFMTDGITVTDLNGVITEVNERVVEMHEFRSKDDVLGKSAFELIAPHDHERATVNMQKTLKKGIIRGIEYTLVRADGSEFPGELSASVLKDTSGNPAGFIAITRDITERKQAEEELQKSEERYRTLFEDSRDAVYITTQEGKVTSANKFMLDLFGYSKEVMIGLDAQELYLHRDDRKKFQQEIERKGFVRHYQVKLRRKDGTEMDCLVTATVRRAKDSSILGYQGIIRDITERKRAEKREKQLQAELYLSSRLASVGELAAGFAHEINNPLTGIIGFSERLMRKSTDEKASQDLEIIHNEGLRAAKIVENLLAFARQRESEKEYADINDILKMALDLRAYELKTSNIKVETDLAPGLPKVMADFHQIQEVFLNIILNAEQAMTEVNRRGKLSIKTQEIENYIRVSFTDDGPGILAEHLDKLFDPFFTTKEIDKGTGLGLSICHGIITEHGGRIYAKSKPGKGVAFFVELPLKTKKTGKSKATEEVPVD